MPALRCPRAGRGTSMPRGRQGAGRLRARGRGRRTRPCSHPRARRPSRPASRRRAHPDAARRRPHRRGERAGSGAPRRRETARPPRAAGRRTRPPARSARPRPAPARSPAMRARSRARPLRLPRRRRVGGCLSLRAMLPAVPSCGIRSNYGFRAISRARPYSSFRDHPVLGSVVRPDAGTSRRDDYRGMVYVTHRPEEPPVAFEVGTVGDAMSRGVISCPPETPLRVVARMMATYGVHAIFVFEYAEDGEAPQLWSVVSDLDLVAATPLDLDEL